MAEHRLRRIQRLHHHRHTIKRNARLFQRSRKNGGKPGGMGRRDKTCKQQAGEETKSDSGTRHDAIVLETAVGRVRGCV
jgi:hypothetical protein